MTRTDQETLGALLVRGYRFAYRREGGRVGRGETDGLALGLPGGTG